MVNEALIFLVKILSIDIRAHSHWRKQKSRDTPAFHVPVSDNRLAANRQVHDLLSPGCLRIYNDRADA